MIYSSRSKKPQIAESAYVAPSAAIVGEVKIADGCVVLHGAVITADGAAIDMGENCVIMEHAVVRAASKPVKIGKRSMVGPHSYVVDCSLPDDSHVPAGALQGENAQARNAETYAALLRKVHAGDAVVETAPRQKQTVEPKFVEVEGVDNAMLLELAEMEHRRQEALRKQRGS